MKTAVCPNQTVEARQPCLEAAGPAASVRESARQVRRRAQLQRVMRDVELRCSDMALTPERVATEFGMSLRALHQLFELSDDSFHEFLTRTRLARAHALLRDSGSRHVGTTEIGFAVGFKETSTFYRRFRQQYGDTPGAVRTAAFVVPPRPLASGATTFELPSTTTVS